MLHDYGIAVHVQYLEHALHTSHICQALCALITCHDWLDFGLWLSCQGFSNELGAKFLDGQTRLPSVVCNLVMLGRPK